MKKILTNPLFILLFVSLIIFASHLLPGNSVPATPTVAKPTAVTPSPTPPPTSTPNFTPTPAYRPITWLELNDFIASDHTNWHEYIPDVYNCVNYALDLRVSANAQNIQAWIAYVVFDPSEPGHTFVGFITSDKGIVFVEPQTDYAYDNVVIGSRLCLKVDTTQCWKSGIVTNVVWPVECDPVTFECWKQE